MTPSADFLMSGGVVGPWIWDPLRSAKARYSLRGFFLAIFATHKRRATLKRISKKRERPKALKRSLNVAAGSPSAVVHFARQELFVSSFNKEDERSELHVDGVQQSHTVISLVSAQGRRIASGPRRRSPPG
jgi:hypothetical protein